MVLRTFILLIAVLASSPVFAKESYTLKFATLLPTGTAWSKLIDNWVKESLKEFK